MSEMGNSGPSSSSPMLFDSKIVMRLTGLTYRQLDYRATQSSGRQHGTGKRRQFTYFDVFQLAVFKALIDTSINAAAAAEALAVITEHIDTATSMLYRDDKNSWYIAQPQKLEEVSVRVSADLSTIRTRLDKAIETTKNETEPNLF